MSSPSEIRPDLLENARYYEYTKAANPIAAGYIPRIPLADFPAHLHQSGESRVIPFDLSDKLDCPWPATSPSLLANFVRVRAGESLETNPDATSQLFHVIQGSGQTRFEGRSIPWSQGDTFVLPFGSGAEHQAESDAAFYFVHDQPLLSYLGAKPDSPRFPPTLYPHEREAIRAGAGGQ